jgi:hypothetical protein
MRHLRDSLCVFRDVGLYGVRAGNGRGLVGWIEII